MTDTSTGNAALDRMIAECDEQHRLDELAEAIQPHPVIVRVMENNRCKVEPRGFFTTMLNVLPSREFYKHRAAGALETARRIRQERDLGCWGKRKNMATIALVYWLKCAAEYRALSTQPIKIKGGFAISR